MDKPVTIVGGGLAGSEAALTLASCGFNVQLYEMRPSVMTPVHKTGLCAELVCSNSLKSTKPQSAAGMLKAELTLLGSEVFQCALENAIDAGGALAVDRVRFAEAVTRRIQDQPRISLIHQEIRSLQQIIGSSQAILLACGPLMPQSLSDELARLFGNDYLAFYDAAAPILLADSLDYSRLVRQNRYGESEGGDYLNAFLDRPQYEAFVQALIDAKRVIVRDFETHELFSACQPVEEIARSGRDALRFGPLKPVGLKDPRTGKRPWAAVQLRQEDRYGQSYNLVGFQTNLTFPEQKAVFSKIPGLEQAEFARFGVMHRNTFINAPALLDSTLRWRDPDHQLPIPLVIVGQLSGTEGYGEAIRSGLHGALCLAAQLKGLHPTPLPPESIFGALIAYATDPETKKYQPMHGNFGLLPPLDPTVKSKQLRYRGYAQRGARAMQDYGAQLVSEGIVSADRLRNGQENAQRFLPTENETP